MIFFRIGTIVLALSTTCVLARAATDASSSVAAAGLEVIDFSRGGSTLSEKEKGEIRNAIEIRRAQIELGRVHVAVWPDNPIPPSGQPALAIADKELVRKRIATLKSFFVNDLKIDSVTFHDMTDSSDWLARARSASENDLPSLFSQGGALSLSSEQVKLTRLQGGPQKAVVLLPLL